MKTKHLTESNADSFFRGLIPMELFTYSDSFLSSEVKELALKNGLEVTYCPPGTQPDKEHGCQTMQVVRHTESAGPVATKDEQELIVYYSFRTILQFLQR